MKMGSSYGQIRKIFSVEDSIADLQILGTLLTSNLSLLTRSTFETGEFR
jgi:hypothetical protein